MPQSAVSVQKVHGRGCYFSLFMIIEWFDKTCNNMESFVFCGANFGWFSKFKGSFACDFVDLLVNNNYVTDISLL